VHHLGGADGAEEVATIARGIGRSASTIEEDLTERGAAGRIANAALAQGPIDIVILNAAVERRAAWTEVTDEDIDFHLNANFRASLQLVQTLIPPMASRGWGRVVGIGSIMGNRPSPTALVYGAMKRAQQAMLVSIGHVTVGSGVTVNTVTPGAVLTGRSSHAYADPSFRARVEARVPAGRLAAPADCVAPVLMLCSEDAGYISGTDIAVDGGWAHGDAFHDLWETRQRRS
jgi:3-oxoacyl-[acyl-carrier protein] reductase